VVLKERPAYPLLGASAASRIHRLIAAKNIRQLEDGPVGGTQLHFGDDVIGQAMDGPLPEEGIWNLARIADLSLAQAAYQLATSRSRIWLPGMSEKDAVNVSIKTLGPGRHVDTNSERNCHVSYPLKQCQFSGTTGDCWPGLNAGTRGL
jgi:hypothetical protein